LGPIFVPDSICAMKSPGTFIVCLGLQWLALPAMAEGAAEMSAPLSKVLELMDDLSSRVVDEGDKADKAYRAYFEWCDDAASAKRGEIKALTARQEKLSVTIDKLTSSAVVAAAQIEDLGKGLGAMAAQLKDAKAIRAKEASEFAEGEAELMDTIDTLGRAVAVIEKEMGKKKGAFAQVNTTSFNGVVHTLGLIVDAAGFSVAGKQKLMALVQSRQAAEDAADQGSDSDDGLGDGPPVGAPAPALYTSKSGGIVEVLEDLKEKADDELQELRGAEAAGKQNFEMLAQSLQDSMANARTDKGDAEALKSKSGEDKAAAQGELETTNKALAEAKSRNQDIKQVCMQTASDHEQSVAARKEELEVISKAKAVLQSAMGGAGSPAAFLQVTSRAHGRARSRARTRLEVQRAEVLSVVNRLARTYHSAALSQLASRISAQLKLGGAGGSDPFAKIKAMISDLVAKLEAEANEAAEEKAYCDDELAKTKEKKSELEEDLDKLSAKIDKAMAKSTGLKGDVKNLQAELAEVAKLQAQVDGVRRSENAIFNEEKAELDKALEGVRRALTVLRQYFGKGEADSLLQSSGSSLLDIMRQPKPPMSFSKSSGAGAGIIGILEVCESDFAKELSKITTEEEDSQSNYEETTQENRKDTEMKIQEVRYKVRAFKALDKNIADMAEDKDTLTAQQSAVLEYWSKITDRCGATPEPFEERRKRREQEIAGLKEALSVLESETALVQRGQGRSHQAFLGVD